MKLGLVHVLELQDEELTEERMEFVLRLVASKEPTPFALGQNRLRSDSEEL